MKSLVFPLKIIIVFITLTLGFRSNFIPQTKQVDVERQATIPCFRSWLPDHGIKTPMNESYWPIIRSKAWQTRRGLVHDPLSCCLAMEQWRLYSFRLLVKALIYSKAGLSVKNPACPLSSLENRHGRCYIISFVPFTEIVELSNLHLYQLVH